MAETLDNSMGDFIARFIQRLSRDPTLSGMTPDEIKQEALKRIKEAEARRTAAKNKEVSDLRAKKSKEWADKVKSKDAKTQQEALIEAEKAKYSAATLPVAKEHLTDIKKVFDRDPPVWIKTDIQECAQAAELIARVTQLPPELQDDPNVLFLEVAKFNKSMNWSEAPLKARKEARIVQDKVLEQIRRVASPAFGDASRDALLWEVDSGQTHLNPLITDASSGEQIQQLQTTIDTNQEILDLQENRSPENQREQLDNFIKDLRSGIGGKNAQYDRTEALKYVASAQARLNLLDSKIIEQRQYGQRIQWDENLEKLYRHHDHKIGEALELGRYLGFNDVKEIAYEGIPGQRKWLARFREKWVGATGESFKPGLEADMQFQEFMRITSWLNGKEHAALTLQYRDLWSLYEDIDSIIKSTLYRPKGQKAEDSFNINRYLSNVHHDMLRKYDLVDIAKPAVSEAIEDVMRDEMFLYQEKLDYLAGEFERDKNNKPIRRVDRFKALRDRYIQKEEYEEMIKLRDEKGRWHQEYHDKDGATVLDRHGRPINNEERLRRLEEQFIGKSETYGGLSQPEYNEMLELETMVDEIGRGVLLRDYHMLVHVEPYSRLLEGHKEYKEIMWDLDPKNHNEPPSQTDRDKKIKRRDELVGEMQQQWKEFTRNNNAEFNPDKDGELLMELRNFSPVEIRAYNRVVQTLRSDWIRGHGGTLEGFETNLKDNSYKIRDAVWAARTIVVGTGEAMEKGGKLGRSARFDLEFTLGLPKEIKTKHFMDRGFAEAYQRVVNPYIFEEDFHIGSKMGETSRNLNYEAAFNEVGYDYKKDPSMPPEWKKLVKLAEKGRLFADEKQTVLIPVWVVYTQYAQEVMGMSFTEALRPDLLATGLQQLSTYWRMQRVALEPIIKEYLKTKKPGDSPEFQALGIQLASLEEKDIGGRMQVVRRMLERKPSIFFKLVGKDLLPEVILKSTFTGLIPGTEQWQNFQDTLALTEMELWRDPVFANKQFDLTDLSHNIPEDTTKLKELVKRAAQSVEPKLRAKPDDLNALVDKYFNLLSKMKDYMRDVPKEGNGKTRLENWANHKFSNLLLLSSSDFNWQKTDFSQLDMYGLERRIGDFQGQKRAEESRRDVLTKQELLSPIPGKEVETLAKIKGFRDDVISYAGDDTGEIAAAALLRTVIEFNRNRASQTLAGWVPGMVSIMRRMNVMNENFEVTLENTPKRLKWLSKPIQHFMEDHKLAGKPINKWPRSIADSVSLAVGFGGPEANAWDEFKVAGFLAGAETSMMFVKHPEKLARMRNRFKTTSIFRFIGVARKYWWVVPVATLAVALTTEIEEEKKGRH